MFPSQHHSFTQSDNNEKSPILFLLFMLVVIQVLWATHGPVDLMEGGIVDTDSYMRLNRVLHLVESGDWFDSTFPRSNAPYGEEQHWTRPMDALLILGAALATPFISFPTALHWWGVMISPLFQVVTLLSLIWLAKPVFERDRLLILGGIFLLQPGVIAYYLAGRVDHHGIILFCFILLLACTLRIAISSFDWRVCVAAGVSAGFGIWVSVELMIGLFVSLTFLSCCWIVYGQDWAKRLMIMTVSLWAVATLALVVERGMSQFFVAEYDRYSIVHWTVFTCLAVVWMGIWFFSEQRRIGDTLLSRVMLALAGGMAITGLMWMLFPKFFFGPLVDADPRVITLHWQRVTETQPLISTDPWQFGRLMFMLGIAIPGIPYLMWLMWTEKEPRTRTFWFMIAIGVLVYLPLTIREMRWVPYAEFLLVVPYAQLIHRIVLRYDRLLRFPWQGIVKGGVVLVGALGFVVGGSTLMAAEGSGVSGTTAKDCPIIPLSTYLNEPTGLGNQERTILAFVDFGPELLYRTRHRVVATPYHRNAAGIVDTYRVLSDSDDEEALRILHDRQVDLILICPASPTEVHFYEPPGGGDTRYERLRDGTVATWLHEIVLPKDLSQSFKLFELVQ